MPRYGGWYGGWVAATNAVTTSTTAITTPYSVIWHPATYYTAATMTAISYTNTATTWANAGNWVVYDEVSAFVVPYPARAPAILSARTRRRMQREQRQYELAAVAAREIRLAEEHRATERARALLYSALTPDQQRSLAQRNYFDLNINGKTYRIKQGTHGNVRLVQGGVETMLYCAQPPNVPAEDAMLAQKLMLECDEQAFLRVANARVLARAA